MSLVQVIRAERTYLGQKRSERGLNSARMQEAEEVASLREVLGDRITELLSPAQLEVLNLAYPPGDRIKKYAEVIAVRGGKKQAVQSALARALRNLRKQASKQEDKSADL